MTGGKRYIAIGRDSEKMIAASDTRSGLANLLRQKRVKDVFILENPKVRQAHMMKVPKGFKKTEGYKKYYLGVY